MRRRTPLLVLVVLALLAAACGGDDGGGQATDPGGGGGGDGGGAQVDPDRCPVDALDEAAGVVQINFWHGMTAANEETLEALVAEYNASQDRVQVRLSYQGTYDEMSDKYIAALRGGDLPHVIQLEETRLQPMIDSESMLPAQACVDAADYDLSNHLERVVGELTVEGVLWPMPFNVSGPVLFYDTTDFEAAGLDPADPPSTFEEMRAAAQTIKDSGAAETGIALTVSPGIVEQWFAKAGQPIVDNDNGRSGRATEALLDTEVGLEAYRFIKQLVDEDLVINVGRNANESDNLLALGAGRAGMTIGTSAAIGSIFAVQDAGQYQDVGVGVGPLPGPDSPDGGVLSSGAALWMVERGHGDQQKAATWDFLRWLNEPEQSATWALGTGYMPIRTEAVDHPDVAALYEFRPVYRVAFDQLSASNAGAGPVIGAYKEFREAIVASLERMVIRGQAPEEALAQADREATAAIRRYNELVGA